MARKSNSGDALPPFLPRFASEGGSDCVFRAKNQGWLFEQAEKRLSAANEAVGSTRTFFFAFLSVAAYIGVVIASTTDEQLLRVSPVKLPIIDVEVPLTGFYIFVPWLFVLLHLNLLIHLGLSSKKLKGFLDDLNQLEEDLGQRLRRDVSNFPFAQWMVGNHDAVLRTVLTILVWITLVLIPPYLLLWMQLRFLAFQDETFTAQQAAAVAVDSMLIVGFQAWFVRHIQDDRRWLEKWQSLLLRKGMSPTVWKRLVLVGPLLNYVMLLLPLGLAAYLAVGLLLYVSGDKVVSCDPTPNGVQQAPHRITWLCEQFRLVLQEKLLTRNTPLPQVVNALRRGDFVESKAALDQTLGLDLKNRRLRGAFLHSALLPRADFRGAQLQGANLRKAQLQDANLRGAKLQGADLSEAQLQGADLSEAQLMGADLSKAQLLNANVMGAKLRGADLRKARLRQAVFTGAELLGAFLVEANLQDANLRGAELREADLTKARLHGAILDQVQFQSANLRRASLRNASLRWANLEDAALIESQLQGAALVNANMQGATLGLANLEWAELTDTDLYFADLGDVKNIETTELGGANFAGANLLGTFLGIDAPAPDVLPAP